MSSNDTRSPTIALPTRFGELSVAVSKSGDTTPAWVAVFKKPWRVPPLLRIHSSCLFAESLLSKDCDCAMQLHAAMKAISEEGGAIVYLYQEGRGQGLFRKVQGISVEQDQGVDTAEAYRRLGYELDPRDYGCVGEALTSIGFPRQVRLITANPRKIAALARTGFEVVERVAPKLPMTARVKRYLETKVRGLGHYGED